MLEAIITIVDIFITFIRCIIIVLNTAERVWRWNIYVVNALSSCIYTYKSS